MADTMKYDGKVAIVTGAGGGLGRAYALFLASRGASVVVNDLGGSVHGDSVNAGKRPADVVVDEIISKGGKAVANYDSVEFGEKIVETAVKAFGTVHIVINNAGILRDVSFKNMTEKDWDLIYQVHVYGAYSVTHAAWPYFRKQKFGRVVCTTSPAGLYGNFGQTNYSSAKSALVGFSETLAKEGAKYNITSNVIAPLAASRMTEGLLPKEVLEKLSPEFIVPLVAFLVHESVSETNGIFELAGGFFSKVRWQRSKGALFKTDESFTPSAILAQYKKITDFSTGAQYPTGPADFLKLIEEANKLPPAPQGPEVSLKDRVVVITGASGGIGRAYALLFAKYGAKVVANDLGDNVDKVVEEIKAAGGIAVADKHSVVEGDKVVKTAIDNFGTVHAVINNAGILRDKSFLKMTPADWNSVIDVHVKGAFAITKAAWPYFLKQKYGRVINTTSTSGIYGNFGQANYAAAKCGLLGFSRSLSQEGAKYNILVNTIAPNAASAMTRTVWPEEALRTLLPEYIAPLTVLLASDKAPCSNELFEIGSGWIGNTRLERSEGVVIPFDKANVPESLAANWADIVDFSGKNSYPKSLNDSSQKIFAAVSKAVATGFAKKKKKTDGVGREEASTFSYTPKDLILYNLGVGAKATELKYVYEKDPNFTVLPTYGVIPPMVGADIFDYDDLVPNFNPMMLLHGEQFLEILKWPLPPKGSLTTKRNVIEVLDKGKAAVVITGADTSDDKGNVYFHNEMTTFIRGSGGFGGPSAGKDRGPATAANKPPARKPDFVTEIKTSEDQAAIYRLSGDFNPLHIDPKFAAVGKFPKPILHGLCSFGVAAKALVDKYGVFKNIKVRFAGHVFPGETLRVLAWKEGKKVIFVVQVVERDTFAITSAAVELPEQGKSKL